MVQIEYPEVLLLLQFEDVGVELLLEFLIGVIDAELFERVYFEGLKAIYVQDTWKEKLG